VGQDQAGGSVSQVPGDLGSWQQEHYFSKQISPGKSSQGAETLLQLNILTTIQTKSEFEEEDPNPRKHRIRDKVSKLESCKTDIE